MANTFTKIASITTSNAVSTVIFSSIPQTYTDLIVLMSARWNQNQESSSWSSYQVQFNGDSSANYGSTYGYGLGASGAGGARGVNTAGVQPGWVASTGTSANIFGNSRLYIPNYTNTHYKQIIGEGHVPNNTTTAMNSISASSWKSTAAINSLTFIYAGAPSNLWGPQSTFTLYGI